jgi:uncharacterized protein
MRWIVLRAIEWYQLKGGGEHFFSVECNFNPSCSEYMKQAISKYGMLKGATLGLKRIKRCNHPELVTKEHDPLL